MSVGLCGTLREDFAADSTGLDRDYIESTLYGEQSIEKDGDLVRYNNDKAQEQQERHPGT